MSLYSDPPPLRDFKYDKPTLLICWWATLLITIIILLRIAGRFVRTERLFTEDRIVAFALIPLYLRMGCIHYVLVHGTNNADFSGVTLSPELLREKEIASGLVLASRIFYAATLWILKNTILEFFKRLTDVTWSRAYQSSVIAIRWFLVITFVAVVISTLAECQPFTHYWQVLPDPGAQCRQGYAQLITMAVCNVVTDLLLVFFPIPIILTSNMKVKRKVQLTLLFSLSISVIVITLYRVPHSIRNHGSQQYRTLMASIELIFAASAANALVLGSFVRNRGIKKQKFRRNSGADSFDRVSSNRRPTLHRQWGSDEDLVRDLGMGVTPELRGPLDGPGTDLYTPAPPVISPHEALHDWQFPSQRVHAERSDDSLLSKDQLSRMESANTPRKISFFDVGGLLEDSVGGSSGSYRRGSLASSNIDPFHIAPTPSLSPASAGFRRGSTTLLQDLGGFLGPLNSRSARQKPRQATELQTIPQSTHEASPSSPRRREPELMDAGGLLTPKP